MDEWGWNPNSVAAIGTIVAALALIVTVIGLRIAYQQERRSRNLQAFFAISEDIRRRWETKWGMLLREQIPKTRPEERYTGDIGRELTFMLNWLDWMGLIVKLGLIDKELLMGSLRSMIVEILQKSAPMIQRDLEDPAKGSQWWANVVYLARQPEIAVDLRAEAQRIDSPDDSEP